MSVAVVGNKMIHYEVLGRGEPVVFIHGWLGSWRYWWSSMQAMAARNRVYALDLWGFGDSSKVPEQYSLDAYVDMLHAFIDPMIFAPITLVGHSLGAAVSLRYTQKYPDRVKRIFAIAPPVRGEEVNNRLTSVDLPSAMSRVAGSSHPEVEMELRKTDPIAFSKLVQEVSQTDFLSDIVNCPKPLLLLYGSQDQVVSRPMNSLPDPNSKLAYISLDGCSHFPMLEDSVKFNRLLMEFMHGDGDLQTLAPKELWQRRTR